MSLSLPPPPPTQTIAELEVKKDKDGKVQEVTSRTNHFWADWFFRLQALLNQLIPAGGAQAAIQFKDEGGDLGASGTVTAVDFTGTGITATRSVNTITITVPTVNLGDVFAFAARH